MKILGKGIDRVRLITRDNLEGVIQSIITKKIFGDRGELELIDNFGEIEEQIRGDRERFLQPLKTLFISGLKINNQSNLEEVCRERNIRFKYFMNKYRENLTEQSKYLKGEFLGDFIEYFRRFNSVKSIIESYQSLIDLLPENSSEKRFELIKLLGILGKKRFIERFSEDNSLEFSKDEKSLIVIESERLERMTLAIIYNSETCLIDNYRAKISFSTPTVYSEYIMKEIIRRDSSVEVAILFELPKSIKIMFREGVKADNLKLIKGADRLEGMIDKKILPIGLKKTIFELMKFYGEKIEFVK